MTRDHGLTVLSGVLALSALALSGCAASTSFSDLTSERSAADDLPELPGSALEETVDVGSARHVGSYRSVDLWLMKNARDGACLLVYPDEVTWSLSCSKHPDVFTVSGSGGEFMVLPDGLPAPAADAEKISANVYAVTAD